MNAIRIVHGHNPNVIGQCWCANRTLCVLLFFIILNLSYPIPLATGRTIATAMKILVIPNRHFFHTQHRQNDRNRNTIRQAFWARRNRCKLKWLNQKRNKTIGAVKKSSLLRFLDAWNAFNTHWLLNIVFFDGQNVQLKFIRDQATNRRSKWLTWVSLIWWPTTLFAWNMEVSSFEVTVDCYIVRHVVWVN
jgi:hypothetical protein